MSDYEDVVKLWEGVSLERLKSFLVSKFPDADTCEEWLLHEATAKRGIFGERNWYLWAMDHLNLTPEDMYV